MENDGGIYQLVSSVQNDSVSTSSSSFTALLELPPNQVVQLLHSRLAPPPDTTAGRPSFGGGKEQLQEVTIELNRRKEFFKRLMEGLVVRKKRIHASKETVQPLIYDASKCEESVLGLCFWDLEGCMHDEFDPKKLLVEEEKEQLQLAGPKMCTYYWSEISYIRCVLAGTRTIICYSIPICCKSAISYCG